LPRAVSRPTCRAAVLCPLHAIDNYSAAIFERNAAETADLMRRIGHMLIQHRRPDLWQQAYRAYLAVQWPDHDYHDGDETDFLRGSGSLPQ
jgi:hypothetical protein